MGSDLPDGHRLETHAKLPSTNAAALAALADGDPGRLWIVAEVQDSGRGRHGRAWVTQPGNLAATLALRDPAPAERLATLSLVASLALHDALAYMAGPPIVERLALKWPNDVLLDGCKIAGILIEGQKLEDGAFGLAIGWGVNCIAHPGLESRYPSSSLFERGFVVEARRLLPVLARSMDRQLARWASGAGFTDIREDWLSRASGVGEQVTVRLANREDAGVFETLDEAGNLVLRRSDGEATTVSAGDVFGPGERR